MIITGITSGERNGKRSVCDPPDDASGGVITWDPEADRYREYGSEQFG